VNYKLQRHLRRFGRTLLCIALYLLLVRAAFIRIWYTWNGCRQWVFLGLPLGITGLVLWLLWLAWEISE